MKKINNWTICLIICFGFAVLLFGCDSTLKTNDFSEVSMSDYYEIKDFRSITIGESTYQDVCKVASTESMQVTSYGGFCEYPMQNGGYIRIKFYGKDLIVGAIERID